MDKLCNSFDAPSRMFTATPRGRKRPTQLGPQAVRRHVGARGALDVAPELAHRDDNIVSIALPVTPLPAEPALTSRVEPVIRASSA
ncbi:hypothetical protein T492DRAFT_1083038 [Pavlovales sp. CCMP2436]|nr:hypothetical protein T492DRAFT_1083038 [Pavlovales sp. CCMP2436]